MTSPHTSRRVVVAAAIALTCALYLANLSGMGLVSTDEPRYAAIGRAMALSGDWITPRLWGHAWFEKPPLLYWMVASGFELGLGPEIAPRLLVALCGLGFLVFFWFRLRKLWDSRVATCATALLSTSAGWLAYSHVAVTDVPAAVFFSAAVLLSLDDADRRVTPIAALLGFAALAKSLLPLGMFLPVLVLDFRRWREWLRPGPVLAFALIALPWHILCTARNGSQFLKVLFLDQQFGRLTSSALKHDGNAWWYYLPILLLFLFPWFPLLTIIPRHLRDPRIRTLLGVVLFGLFFLSCSVNKLAGYVLPLLPAICVLMGVGFARAAKPARPLAVSIALLGFLPLAAGILPVALANGLRAAPLPGPAVLLWPLAGAAAGAVVLAFPLKNSLLFVAALAAGCFLWFQFAVFPDLDRLASARPLWLSTHPDCVPPVRRQLQYGLNYYAGRELFQCDILDQSGTRVIR